MMKRKSIFQAIYNLPTSSHNVQSTMQRNAKGSIDMVQRLGLLRRLPVHNGCVNTVAWDETGEYLLSGSDDLNLVVTHGHSYKVLMRHKTAHRANIFSAKFMPVCDNKRIVSCSGDGAIMITGKYLKILLRRDHMRYLQEIIIDIEDLACVIDSSLTINQFNCHTSTCYEVITLPMDPNSFMSCGEDGTVRWFDTRIKVSCTKVRCRDDIIIEYSRPITALAVNPKMPYQLALACSNPIVRTFDIRMLGTNLTGRCDKNEVRTVRSFKRPTKHFMRITSLCFSPDGHELLVNYSNEDIYVIGVNGDIDVVDSLARAQDASIERQSPRSPPPIRRLRLRGDWSDTGPEARPESEIRSIGQARPQLQTTLMQRMTDVLSRMLNDPLTRAALSSGGEDMMTDRREDIPIQHPYPQMQEYENVDNQPPLVEVPSSTSSEHSSSSEGETERRYRNNINDSDAICCKEIAKFSGHRNTRTMIKEAVFYGDDFIMSGSDCGHVFIWDRHTGELVKLLQADNHVVNCLQPHPTLPLLATTGIDYDVKLWAPVDQEPTHDAEAAKSLMQRNVLMLEETRDTVTVPAGFMIRMLACVHSIRHGRPARIPLRVRRQQNEDSDE